MALPDVATNTSANIGQNGVGSLVANVPLELNTPPVLDLSVASGARTVTEKVLQTTRNLS